MKNQKPPKQKLTNNEARLKKILKDFGVKPNFVVPETSFIVGLDFDSLDVIELIMAVECEFKIDISDTEVEQVVTFKDAIDLIEKIINENKNDE